MPADATFHEQLLEKLRRLIRGGKYPAGSQFLTEREVAARFKTSRPTANKALNSLAAECLLEFRRGAGTFVKEGALDYDLQQLVSFTEKAKAAGRKPGTKLIAFKRITADEAPREVRVALSATADEPFTYMERVRLADGKPVIFERRHVMASLGGPMTRAEASGSLYAFWTEKRGLKIIGATESIRAVNATKVQAAMLQVPLHSACLLVVGTGYLEGGKALWYEETLYRADVYEFRNQLGGVNAPRPAMGRMRGE